MEILNQLAAPLAQSAGVARQQSTDKSQQVRRAQALRKDVAARSDTFEHQVESCEEDTPIHDEQRKDKGSKNKNRRQKQAKPNDASTRDDAPPSIDLTA